MELQDYSSKPIIDGVKIIDLQQHFDDSGEFCEVIRLEGDVGTEISTFFPLGNFREVGIKFQSLQINYSSIQPSVIKGFHVHEKQVDVWFLPPGNRCIINLIDARSVFDYLKSGSTYTIDWSRFPRMRITMGVKPQLLVIPSKILHGIANPSLTNTISMVYLVDRFFDPKDEFRISHTIIADEEWRIKNG